MKTCIPNNEKTQNDPFYRYKRDVAVLKEIGGFFILTNIESILKSLNLNTDAFFKYLQKKIGQKVIKDKNGLIKIKSECDIESILESYILKTIVCNKICKSCGNR